MLIELIYPDFRVAKLIHIFGAAAISSLIIGGLVYRDKNLEQEIGGHRSHVERIESSRGVAAEFHAEPNCN